MSRLGVIALSTGSLYSYGVSRVFRMAAETGYDGVELLVDGRWDSRHVGYLLDLRQQYGLPIVSVHSPFAARVEGWETEEWRRIERSVSLAEQVGARVVVTHLPRRWGSIWVRGILGSLRLSLPFWPRMRAYERWLRESLQEAQSRTEVTIAVENMPAWQVGPWRLDRYSMNTLDQWGQLDHLTLDTTHLGTWGLDPVTVYERFKDKIAHIHLSNHQPGATFPEHHLPQEGQLDLGELVGRLATDGYPGAVVVELHPANLGASDEDEAIAKLRAAKAFCDSASTTSHSHSCHSEPPIQNSIRANRLCEIDLG